MPLEFPIQVQERTVYLVAHRIQTTHTAEKFRVHLKWLSKSIIVQNNRPSLLATNSKKPIKWKIKKGKLRSPHLINVIYLNLSEALKEVPVVKPPKVSSLLGVWQ